jgi:hypothetical protein
MKGSLESSLEVAFCHLKNIKVNQMVYVIEK